MEGVGEQTLLALALDIDARTRLSGRIANDQCVRSTVLRVYVEDVQCDETEVLRENEAMSLRQRLVVEQPFILNQDYISRWSLLKAFLT